MCKCIVCMCVCVYIYTYILHTVYILKNIYMYIIYTSCRLITLHCSKVSFLQCCHMKRFNKIFTKKCEGCTHFCEILYINVIIIQIQHTFIKYIYIYAFSRHFYPKRLTVTFRLYIFVSMCSFGIEPTTFCAANAMLSHWATGTRLYRHNKLDKSVC